MICFATYNLLNYAEHDSVEEAARYERVHQVIHGIRAAAGGGLVLAVEEVIADGDGKARLAGKRLQQLAEATGLRCCYEPNKPAIAVGNHRFHVGLLWSDTIRPAGGWRDYSGTNVWHSLAKLQFDVGGQRPVQHAAFHATPFGRYRRADEFERVLSTMSPPRRPAPGPGRGGLERGVGRSGPAPGTGVRGGCRAG